MGEDNLRTFHKWYNYERILEKYRIFVYPRVILEQESTIKEELSSDFHQHPSVIFLADAPVMNISSTYIRKTIAEEKDVNYLLTPPVLKYVDEMGFYRF